MSSTANITRPIPSAFVGTSPGVVLTAGGRLKPGQLQTALTVRAAHHGDLGSETRQPDDAV